MKKIINNIFRISALAGLMMPMALFAEDAAPAVAPVTEKAPMFTGTSLLMFLTILILAVVIYILGRIVKNLVETDTQAVAKQAKISKGLLTLAIFIGTSMSAFAQDAANAGAEVAAALPASTEIFGMDKSLFWTMIGVLFIEFVALMYLCKILYVFLVRRQLIQPFNVVLPKWLQFNTMMGNDIPLEKDAELLTDHDYDGIQELDNGMPPFLQYIFIATIVAAVVYWVNYHTLGASPLQIEEYNNEMARAEVEKQEYLKIAGNNVDENTVKLLADATNMATGAKVFAANCVACHGDKGQGGVGPNLTDAYWLHGGDIQSVFKTIKYGVVAKGMRAWQTEIKPGDIQAVASYILTEFKDKNVPGGKAPQGDLLSNAPSSTAAPADSAANEKPTTAAAPADSTAKG